MWSAQVGSLLGALESEATETKGLTAWLTSKGLPPTGQLVDLRRICVEPDDRTDIIADHSTTYNIRIKWIGINSYPITYHCRKGTLGVDP